MLTVITRNCYLLPNTITTSQTNTITDQSEDIMPSRTEFVQSIINITNPKHLI
jgi:hypothetical protein